MKIGIIDADLCYKVRHRFPNLACMKLSAFHKQQGDTVVLITQPAETICNAFDRLYVSKVFTDTALPEWLAQHPKAIYGGTGFFYDKAPPLPEHVEHIFPDYHLYDAWLTTQPDGAWKAYYTDYSIGFLTRGCFRKCAFCVNQNSNHVQMHSPLTEFMDAERPRICLLDDNFFGHRDWKRLLNELQSSGKRFQFKQGLDIRLLNDEKAEMLFAGKYCGDFIFAFDHIADKVQIEEKLRLARRYTNKNLKLYLFCAFDREDKWGDAFWQRDILEVFERIEVLMRYNALPYLTRYQRYRNSPYYGMYVTLARWCNQPRIFRKKSFREMVTDEGAGSSAYRYALAFEQHCPAISRFYDMKTRQEGFNGFCPRSERLSTGQNQSGL